MAKTTDDAASENAKKVLEAEQAASEKSRAEFASRMKGKPTPTQEELNTVAAGGHIHEHEPDGSDPDPAPKQETRYMEADKKPAPYQTRAARS